MQIVLLLAMLSCSVTTTALSAVIYDEALHGDLPGSVDETEVELDLEFGINVIRAQSLYVLRESGDHTIDYDWLTLWLAAGSQITAIELSLSAVSIDPGTHTADFFIYLTAMRGPSLGHSVSMIGTPQPHQLLFDGAYPLIDTGFWLAADISSLGSLVPAQGSWDYEIAISVTPVPLPAPVWLLLSAVVTLAFRRRSHASIGLDETLA